MGIPSKLRLFGQYVQFCQDIDWQYVIQDVKASGYNGFSAHVTSAWGMNPKFTPWIYLPSVKKFNLTKPNPAYNDNAESFMKACLENKVIPEICFFDAYFTQDWANKGAAKIHPFRNNSNGVAWGDDELNLPESKPWFKHVEWETEGHNFDEKVKTYSFPQAKYHFVWNFIKMWGEFIKEYWKPGRPTTLVRFINENHARYDANGEHQGGFGGEDKIFQVVRLEFEKLGLEHGKAFIMVNDWMPFQGAEFVVNEWIQAGQFDRHPNHLWFREVHGCDEDMMVTLDKAAVKAPQLAGRQFVIRSTDGMKPENNKFIGRSKAIFARGDRIIDIKVPSESEVTNTLLLPPNLRNQVIYFDQDYMKTFDAVLPTMKAIAGVAI